MVVEVGELDEEDELGDFDAVGGAVDGDGFAVEGFGDGDGGAAGGEDVVEKGEMDGVALGLGGCDVGEAVEDLVCAVLFDDVDLAEVAGGERQLAFFADGDDVLNEGGVCEQWRGEKETTCFDGDDVGVKDVFVDVADDLVEGFLVGEERKDVDEIDTGFREIGIMVDDVDIVHNQFGIWN